MVEEDLRNKVVYLHRSQKNNKVFYVGIGCEKRPYDFKSRNNFWLNYVKKYGEPIVEIFKYNLTKKEAFEIEVNLIKKYGRRSKNKGYLVNICKGGLGWGSANEKRVIDLKTGIVHNSIQEYCENYNLHHATISSFLRKENSIRNINHIDYFVRLVIDSKIKWIPCFDGNFSRKDNTCSLISNKYNNVNNNENLNLIKERLNKMPVIDEALIYLSLRNSITFLSERYNLKYFNLYNRLQIIKSKLRNNEDKAYYNILLPTKTKELILADYFNSDYAVNKL